jgi:hypothetical protein
MEWIWIGLGLDERIASSDLGELEQRNAMELRVAVDSTRVHRAPHSRDATMCFRHRLEQPGSQRLQILEPRVTII